MPTGLRDRNRRLSKHTLRLRDGDTALIDAAYPDLGHNRIIRLLVSAHVDQLEAAKAASAPAPDLPAFTEIEEFSP